MIAEAEKILKKLSTEDKINLIGGAGFWRTHELGGVRSSVLSDGPHGIRKHELGGSDNLGINASVPALCFPSTVNVASTFDRDLVYELGTVLGRQCRAYGVDVLLGPGINIKRLPTAGRNFEYYSEDPYLTGEMASKYVGGVQSEGIGVSLKHFACNNREFRRNIASSNVDERALREIYLKAFETVIKQSNPRSVMCAYNKLNGEYCSENSYLLKDILRGDWGYKGLVVSDWGAVLDRAKSLKAGVDLEMPPSREYGAERVRASLNGGIIGEAELDEAAGRVIELNLKSDENSRLFGGADCDSAADRDFARRLARESMVLLKNDGVLPLKKNAKIAFIGEFAEKPRYQGGGSSHVNALNAVSPLEAAKGKFQVTYARGYNLSQSDAVDSQLTVEAIETAGRAAAAVVFLGIPERLESEGYDRKHLDLPYSQTALVRELIKVQDNIAVVLFNGAPVTMPWISGVSAVLEAYLPGEAGGEAVIDLLFGDYSPCGRLAETFPSECKGSHSCVRFTGDRFDVNYIESIFVGYRYYDKAGKSPAFPFGYGLTYTDFEYSDLSVSSCDILSGETVSVELTLKNVGNYKAKETAQVYISPPEDCGVFTAEKALAGFQKVELAPDESKRVKISVDLGAFKYYNTEVKRFVTLHGKFGVKVGASSRDIRLETCIDVRGEDIKSPYDRELIPDYFSGAIEKVTQEEFKILYGALPPESAGTADKREITVYDCLSDTKSTVWGRRINSIISGRATSADKAFGETNMFSESFADIPLIALPSLTDGLISAESVYDLVNLINGKKRIISMLKLTRTLFKVSRAMKNFIE